MVCDLSKRCLKEASQFTKSSQMLSPFTMNSTLFLFNKSLVCSGLMNFILTSASLKENTGDEMLMRTSSLLIRSMIMELSTSSRRSSTGSFFANEVFVKSVSNREKVRANRVISVGSVFKAANIEDYRIPEKQI